MPEEEVLTMTTETYMIEVFKTNVHDDMLAMALIEKVLHHFPHGKINFDLDDCDRILRIKDQQIDPDLVIEILSASGFQCEVLRE